MINIDPRIKDDPTFQAEKKAYSEWQRLNAKTASTAQLISKAQEFAEAMREATIRIQQTSQSETSPLLGGTPLQALSLLRKRHQQSTLPTNGDGKENNKFGHNICLS